MRNGAQIGLMLVCVSALLGSGCKAESSQLAAHNTTRVSSASENAPAPATPPDASLPYPSRPPLPPRDPGPAPGANSVYANVMDLGVFVLDAAGWRLHYPSAQGIRDIGVIDGELFVLTERGVEQVDGQGEAKLVAPFELGEERGEERLMPWEMAVVGPNDFWVLGSRSFGHWQGSWAFEPVHESWGPEPSGGTDIGIDQYGEPWVAWGQVQRRSSERWTQLEFTVGSQVEISPELKAHPATQTMVVKNKCDEQGCELVRYRGSEKGGQWEREQVSLPLEGCPEYAYLSVSDNGQFAALGGFCALMRLRLNDLEAAPTRMTHAEGTWTGQFPRSLAVDDQGRIWTGTSEGLIVADGAGPAQVFPSARLGKYAGAMNRLIVVGEGPPLPKLGEERRAGLRARAQDFQTGEPFANTDVELCNASPGPDFKVGTKGSPCAGVEHRWTTTTDAEGRFEVLDLPVAHYHFGVRIDGVWRGLESGFHTMRAGETAELADVWLMSG